MRINTEQIKSINRLMNIYAKSISLLFESRGFITREKTIVTSLILEINYVKPWSPRRPGALKYL